MTNAELHAAKGQALDFPVIAYGCYRGKRLVAYGGLAWRYTDRVTGHAWCELWLEVKRPKMLPPVALVRAARRMLKKARQLGEPIVFCVREERPGSEKLLKLAGLTIDPGLRTFGDNGAERSGEIFTWRPSQESEQP